MNLENTFKFRCTAQEVGRWGQLAAKDSIGLSAWIRKQCNRAVVRNRNGFGRRANKGKGAK